MLCIAAVMLLPGCNTDTETTETGNIRQAEKDTASIAAGAPEAAAADTILQAVVHLTLTASGNSLEEMRYDQDTLEAKAGALIKLKLINEAEDMTMVHNVVFTAPGKYKMVALAGEQLGASGNYVPDTTTVIASSPIALPGQTVEVEFTAPLKPGNYEFVCTYPEHWRRMHGVFKVK